MKITRPDLTITLMLSTLILSACTATNPYSTIPYSTSHATYENQYAELAFSSPSAQPGIDSNLPVSDNKYQTFANNDIKLTTEHPVSTLSIDVDTGSYTQTRRRLSQGELPIQDSVRAEEFVNYFSYQYPQPEDANHPFAVFAEMGPTPWNPETRLLHLGIQGKDDQESAPAARNLVFLLDVSGSMQGDDRLGLVQKSLTALTKRLNSQDRVSIVVYAGASGVVLKPTPGDKKYTIINALYRLSAGGSTNGGEGIEQAYALARENYIPGGTNRVILCTDGDLNVGLTEPVQLLQLIEQKRKQGIFLTTLGFGDGNYNDHLLEQLADHGNGHYAYINSYAEARKVLIREMNGTLNTIASDVKIQIEFNPAVVSEYRLIGYENRLLARSDFNNDRVDAGEIGSGHSVTALYEVRLSANPKQSIDSLRYALHGNIQSNDIPGNTDELAYVKLRYKKPNTSNSILVSKAIKHEDHIPTLQETSPDFRFSAAVAAFAQRLRGNHHVSYTYPDIARLAQSGLQFDPEGDRRELVSLVETAGELAGEFH
ncbi:hypothetical protein OLMES_0473 [Oleiphilus messinensis]|uniref:VWFA domain-containing protein n=1 Tax=Oleiphilus messinensis TaxID=141451 RepID=A0A1Y0I279_9GAMM|nr:VWA domain-containing protein [Oleiphilus messinensis]ARU54577.1 hypothetical protein OLMES_0473 [Oleiphilus messinensis]